MRTLLFDIDGTLLMTKGGGSGALKLAIEREFGIRTARMEISFSGRTDRSLLVEILQQNNLPTSHGFQQRLRRCYTTVFPQVLANSGGRVLPGIRELLDRLSREDLRCYVMTGNLHETATKKLDHFGLLHFFRGIFGGDHDHDRDRLAERTADTLRRRYGGATTQDIVIIGDTPADVRCGRAIGAKVVAVCTGNFSRDQLEAEKPMSVHDDFSDVSALFDLLTG
jgi:phosphoglycolate phosphatase